MGYFGVYDPFNSSGFNKEKIKGVAAWWNDFDEDKPALSLQIGEEGDPCVLLIDRPTEILDRIGCDDYRNFELVSKQIDENQGQTTTYSFLYQNTCYLLEEWVWPIPPASITDDYQWKLTVLYDDDMLAP